MAHREPKGTVSENIVDTISTRLEKIDITALEEFIEDCNCPNGDIRIPAGLSDLREAGVQIGVIGLSGTGKSSFINAIRGLKARDAGAARTGVKQVTTGPAPYPHPRNNKVIFWDLPGVGTPQYPKDCYVELINLDSFDFFLILSSCRFREQDTWLGNEIVTRGKHFFYVRTKVDIDLRNQKHDSGDDYNEDQVLKNIRHDIAGNMRDGANPTFLVNNRDTQSLDFPLLSKHLIEQFSNLKREILAISLTALNNNVIEEKVNVLSERIWRCAVRSVVSTRSCRVPDCDVVADIDILTEELWIYCFGLYPKDLPKEFWKYPDHHLVTSSRVGDLRVKLREAAKDVQPRAAAKLVKYIPILAKAAELPVSYTSVYSVLQSSLLMLRDAALNDTEPQAKYQATLLA